MRPVISDRPTNSPLNTITVFALVFVAVGASGCAINHGSIREMSLESAVQSNKGIVLIDAGFYEKGGLVTTALQSVHQLFRRDALERQFYLIDRKAERYGDGRLSVYFLFQNTYGNRNWLDLQIVFYDEKRRVVERTEWEVKEFPKQVKVDYVKKSLSSDAVGYELYVRNYR